MGLGGALAASGYGVGSSWHNVVRLFSDAGYVLAAFAVVLVAIVFVHRIGTYRRQRALELQHDPG